MEIKIAETTIAVEKKWNFFVKVTNSQTLLANLFLRKRLDLILH